MDRARLFLIRILLPVIIATGVGYGGDRYLLQPACPTEPAHGVISPLNTARGLGGGAIALGWLAVALLGKLAERRKAVAAEKAIEEETTPLPGRKRKDTFVLMFKDAMAEMRARDARMEKKLARIAKEEMPEGAALLADSLELAHRTSREAMQLVARDLDAATHHLEDVSVHYLDALRGLEASEAALRAFRKQYLPTAPTEDAPAPVAEAVPEKIAGDPPPPDGAA